MAFDPKCKELAEYFLADCGEVKASVDELAQRIQDAVEDYLQSVGQAFGECA
jgi:lipase chaperone LimK